MILRLVIWPSITLFWTETKLWTLKYGSKSKQTSLVLRQHPPKSYKLTHKIFMIFRDTFYNGLVLPFVRSSVGPTVFVPVLRSPVRSSRSLQSFVRSLVRYNRLFFSQLFVTVVVRYRIRRPFVPSLHSFACSLQSFVCSLARSFVYSLIIRQSFRLYRV